MSRADRWSNLSGREPLQGDAGRPRVRGADDPRHQALRDLDDAASAFGSSSRNVRRKGAARLLEGQDVLLARHEAPGEAQGKGGEGQVAPDHDSRSERLLPDRGAKLQGLRQ
jgi:hypothetical protein